MRMVPVFLLIAALFISFKSEAGVDYNCVNQCVKQGSLYSFCVKQCSFKRRINIVDPACQQRCVRDGNMINYCNDRCSKKFFNN